MSKLPMPFSNPRTYTNHSGVDFPQKRGTPIPALGPGTVLRTPYTERGGWWTTIRYDNGVTLGSAHQDTKPSIPVGKRVAAGDTIGHVGSLGLNSTGPHLHLENINSPTYAGVMAVLDTSRVVGAGAPASTGGGTVWHSEYSASRDKHLNDPIITLEDDEMILIESLPDRGRALVGAGYFRPLRNSEELREAAKLATKTLRGNARQFDVWKAISLQGRTPSTSVTLSAEQVEQIAAAAREGGAEAVKGLEFVVSASSAD